MSTWTIFRTGPSGDPRLPAVQRLQHRDRQGRVAGAAMALLPDEHALDGRGARQAHAAAWHATADGVGAHRALEARQRVLDPPGAARLRCEALVERGVPRQDAE